MADNSEDTFDPTTEPPHHQDAGDVEDAEEDEATKEFSATTTTAEQGDRKARTHQTNAATAEPPSDDAATEAATEALAATMIQSPMGFFDNLTNTADDTGTPPKMTQVITTAEQEAAVAGDLFVSEVTAAAAAAAASTAAPGPDDNNNEEQPSAEAEPIVVDEGAIWVPAANDVLSGRGASVNSHDGNKKFRALCFSRKAMFDAANHAAKRRIATEIWTTCVGVYQSRYLKKRQDKGPWYELGTEQAILKAAQVMRDYRRPDRLVQREMLAAEGKKRNRATATPMDDIPIPPPPAEPIIENPVGVHEHDVLCGRGAFVNGHTGNQHLRHLALARKSQFDAGTYTDKRHMAVEIYTIIKGLKPPGRFLRKAKPTRPTRSPDGDDDDNEGVEGQAAKVPPPAESDWEELNVERSIHKACQVMRDIDRQDRKDREDRRRVKKQRNEGPTGENQDVKKEAFSASVTVDKAMAAVEGGLASPEKSCLTETV